MARQLYKDDIGKYKDSTGCIPKSAEIYKNSDGNIDFKEWQKDNPDGYARWESETKKCNSDFYNSDQEGCCYNESINEPKTPDKVFLGLILINFGPLKVLPKT